MTENEIKTVFANVEPKQVFKAVIAYRLANAVYNLVGWTIIISIATIVYWFNR